MRMKHIHTGSCFVKDSDGRRSDNGKVQAIEKGSCSAGNFGVRDVKGQKVSQLQTNVSTSFSLLRYVVPHRQGVRTPPTCQLVLRRRLER